MMSGAACPYCRAKIGENDVFLACEGCGTLHHVDCYAENGGCTIFGCCKAPADEPKLHVSVPELQTVESDAPVAVAAQTRVAAPPPPPPGVAVGTVTLPSTLVEPRQWSHPIVPSIFGGFVDQSGVMGRAIVEPEAPQHKSRTTFIVLGALLGAFGAHSFYAGYKKKGAIQLAITLLSMGFAGPMTWVWAVIDICTINQDHLGVQFEA